MKVATGVKRQPEIEIPLSGFVKPAVSVTPISINFGNFDPKGDAFYARRAIKIFKPAPAAN